MTMNLFESDSTTNPSGKLTSLRQASFLQLLASQKVA